MPNTIQNTEKQKIHSPHDTWDPYDIGYGQMSKKTMSFLTFLHKRSQSCVFDWKKYKTNDKLNLYFIKRWQNRSLEIPILSHNVMWIYFLCPSVCQVNLHIAMATLSELRVAPILYLTNLLSSQQSQADNKHQADINVILVECYSVYKGVNYWVNPIGKDIPKLEISLCD